MGVDRLIGRRFGRYVVIDTCPDNSRKVLCRCDCGNEKYVYDSNLLSGRTMSCGCLSSDVTAERNYKHGETKTRLYHVWLNMKRRCNDPRNNRYKDYGGKGVKVCDDWDDFAGFKKWADDTGYDPDARYGQCTIDRIDVNGNYEPGNCRWATIREQCNNRTTNHLLTYNGITKNITEWEEYLGVDKGRLDNRIRKGWSTERAIETPFKRKEKIV